MRFVWVYLIAWVPQIWSLIEIVKISKQASFRLNAADDLSKDSLVSKASKAILEKFYNIDAKTQRSMDKVLKLYEVEISSATPQLCKSSFQTRSFQSVFLQLLLSCSSNAGRKIGCL